MTILRGMIVAWFGFFALWGVTASAAVIAYDIAGTGTGRVTDSLGAVSPFGGLPFNIRFLGNTTLSGPTSTGRFVVLTSGTISGLGSISFGAGTPLFVTVPNIAPGVGGVLIGSFLAPTFTRTFGFGGGGLLNNYDGLSDLGPVGVNAFQPLFFNLAGGSRVNFDSFTGATFTATVGTAAVPEPTTWAMMLTGFGLAGVALRRRSTATVSA